MALPLLLAGPILRRVEPNLVTVWLALSDGGRGHPVGLGGPGPARRPAERVRHQGDAASRPGGSATSSTSPWSRRGSPRPRARRFQPDTLYSYDVTIEVGSTTHTLQSLHMLRDASAAESPDGIAHVAARLRARRAAELRPAAVRADGPRILYGSCRRPEPPRSGRDGLDRRLRRRRTSAIRAPGRTSCSSAATRSTPTTSTRCCMLGLMDLGDRADRDRGPDGVPRQRGRAGPARQRRCGARAPAGRRRRKPDDVPTPTRVDAAVPAPTGACRSTGPTSRPAGGSSSTKRAAQFTSTDGSSHLISLGEFAALYLLVWSNACWTRRDPGRHVRRRRRRSEVTACNRCPWSSPITTEPGSTFPR